MRRAYGLALACAALVTLARPLPCGAQGAGYFYRDVIPDAFVVKTQCGRLRHALESLAMHADAQTLDRVCARYQENHDGDAWMDAYQPLREKLISRWVAQHGDPKLLDGLGDSTLTGGPSARNPCQLFDAAVPGRHARQHKCLE